MASPTVRGAIENARTSIGSPHTADFTGALADDLLICLMSHAVATAFSDEAGWTRWVDAGNANDVAVFYKKAAGGETTVDFDSVSGTRSANIAYVINGAEDPATTTPTISTVATGTSTAPNADNCNPAVSNDYLAITFFVQAGEEDDDDTWCNSAPTNYSSLLQKTTGIGGAASSNCSIASAVRALTGVSSEDAGAFDTDQSLAWRAHTIMVPAPAAPPATITMSVGHINIGF